MNQQTRGAIAAGHPETVEAGLAIFRMGGNVFDAVVGAMLASCVAEPALTSLAGGGFLLAHTADNHNTLFDFFSQTPCHKRDTRTVDFRAVDVNFGTATQQFHMGMGAIATPGTLAGIMQVHQRLGRIPFSEVMAPALHLARTGALVNDFQAYCYGILSPILLASPEMRQILAPTGERVKPGDRITLPQWANTLESIAAEGVQVLYGGDIGQQLVQDCRDRGGYLTREDLETYQVIERSPLTLNYRGHTLLTNPPPSSGGALIAFSLGLLSQYDLGKLDFGSPNHIERLARVMQVTNLARKNGYDQRLYDPHILDTFLADSHIADYLPLLESMTHAAPLNKWGSTTHISAIDAEGNAASVTASNGEGSSYVIPGTGIMTNNMLGEADLHPHGFHRWVENQRISSMMAPTMVLRNGKPEIVLGSGGSNRIRTAILQVVSNLLDFHMPVQHAINAPRIHWENDVFNLEPGFSALPTHLLTHSPTQPPTPFPYDSTVIPWDTHNMFFGGVHAVVRQPDGAIDGGGDRRRGGAFASLP